jgi:hypothetical protein
LAPVAVVAKTAGNNKQMRKKINTSHMNNFFNCALIITLLSESGEKTLLQPKEEPKSSDGLQLHLAEIPGEERLIQSTDAFYSGIQSLSQSKTSEYNFVSWPGGSVVRVKILAESPSQIFSLAEHFADLISL